jgi:DNA repair exonuclease SbcCD nuclease subunit
VTTFLHTADWQLGMTRHFLSPEAQARFTAARTDAIRRIGTLAQSEGCPFVVVCGDVFETNHVERQVVVRALEAMAATPAVTFFLLPGNHDPLDAASVFTSPTFVEHQPANVVVLAQAGVHQVQPGLELVAAPWTSKRPLSDLLADACGDLPADGTVRIAVAHGAVDVLSPETSNPALVSVAAAEAALHDGQVHYVALGDRHSTKGIGRTGRIWYSGAPEPTDHREVDAGNVLLVQVEGSDAPVVVPKVVATWRFTAETFDLAGDDDVQRIATWLDALDDKERTIVRLTLVGHLTLAARHHLDQVLEHHGDLLAALEVSATRSELVVLPDADDFDDLGLAGFARAAVDDLRGVATGDDEPAATARDALGLLYRLGGAA